MKKYFNLIYFNDSKVYNNIVIILLITFGIFFISNPISDTLLIGAVLTIIGFFLAVLKIEKKTTDNLKEFSIQLILTIWVIIVYIIIITLNLSVEILFFLILIGLIVIYEITSNVISPSLRNRIHITIYIFLIINILMLIKRIINIISM